MVIARKYKAKWRRKSQEKDGVAYICILPNGIVNHVVVGRDFLLCGIGEILHTGNHLLEVDIAEPPVEQDFARVQSELEAQLLIVNRCIPAQIQQRVVEIGQRFFKVT